MLRVSLIFSILLLSFFSILAQDGYKFQIKIDGFEEKEAYLGYYFADKQYLKDTAEINSDGYFVFEGEEEMEGGLYLIVLPPDNQFIQILLNRGEQHFKIETHKDDLAGKMKVTGSPDNELFYSYLNFLAAQRPEADRLRKAMEEADEKDKSKLETELTKIDDKVVAYQKMLVEKHPNSMSAAIIKANLPWNSPEFGEGENAQVKQWRWMQKHYFDNIDLTDPRMLRTPFLHQRVKHYIEKLTVQHPDTINLALDYVLEKMEPAEETYRYFIIHFLNEYAKSKVVGFDAVYVHLALNYYAKGKAPWTEEDQLEKIIDNGKKLDPLLIGKIAPNIQMQTQDGQKIWLHDFKAPYTVLFFWDPDCGHCKKATPHMIEFYNKFKEKGVEVFAICTALVTRDDDGKFSMEEVNKCWTTIEEKGIGIWFNAVDPYHRSRYKSIYDIRTTPQIYILSEEKEILSKKIGAEQLEEVMNKMIEIQSKQTGN